MTIINYLLPKHDESINNQNRKKRLCILDRIINRSVMVIKHANNNNQQPNIFWPMISKVYDPTWKWLKAIKTTFLFFFFFWFSLVWITRWFFSTFGHIIIVIVFRCCCCCLMCLFQLKTTKQNKTKQTTVVDDNDNDCCCCCSKCRRVSVHLIRFVSFRFDSIRSSSFRSMRI